MTGYPRPSLRGLELYASSRMMLPVVAASCVLLALGYLWVWRHQGSTGDQIPGQTMPGLLSGILLGISVASPFGELEDAVRAPARLSRLIVFGVTLAVLTALFGIIASVFFYRTDAMAMLVRAIVGYAALTIILLPWLGATRAWLPPLIWGMLATFSVQSNWTYPWWAWAMQPGGDVLSWVFAGSMLVLALGTAWLMPFSPRWHE